MSVWEAFFRFPKHLLLKMGVSPVDLFTDATTGKCSMNTEMLRTTDLVSASHASHDGEHTSPQAGFHGHLKKN